METRPVAAFHSSPDAASQLHQTGQSCIAQHFSRVNVSDADEAGFRCGCVKGCFVVKPNFFAGDRPEQNCTRGSPA